MAQLRRQVLVSNESDGAVQGSSEDRKQSDMESCERNHMGEERQLLFAFCYLGNIDRKAENIPASVSSNLRKSSLVKYLFDISVKDLWMSKNI